MKRAMNWILVLVAVVGFSGVSAPSAYAAKCEVRSFDQVLDYFDMAESDISIESMYGTTIYNLDISDANISVYVTNGVATVCVNAILETKGDSGCRAGVCPHRDF